METYLETFGLGLDAGQGNLLGIQPFLRREDYASEAAFYNRIAEYLHMAVDKDWASPRTVAVLPEHIGTWLVTAEEGPSVAAAPTIAAVARRILLRRLFPTLRQVLAAKERDRVTAALFRVKAGTMARIYQGVFSQLAREFSITIVAGSIVLPEPTVVEGTIRVGAGPLYNTAFVFRPDGCAENRAVRKVVPIESERPFTTGAPVRDLPVFDTPAGKLGVLVCADSWFPEPYARLKEQGVELLAVPSASEASAWEQPWNGYNGRSAPGDMDPADVGQITERQAWGKYAMGGRIAASGARVGVNVFLYGDLWDLAFNGGRWRIIKDDQNIEGRHYSPALINVWI